MAGTIKGMTIEIGGNTEPLEQALKSTNKEIKTTQNELREVNKALKLDPSNVTLLKQKQELLGQQIGQTTTKINALKQAQKQMETEMKKGGEVNQEEYRKLSREIATAEVSLKDLKKQAKECHPYLNKVGEALSKVGEVGGKLAKGTLDMTIQGVQLLGKTALATSTSLLALATKSGALADDLNTLASQTGLSTKELQEFQYASDLIDVDMNTLTGALKKTTSAMNSAKDGTGSSAEAFKKLGVQIKNADGSLRDNNDVFKDSIKALGKISNETERDALAMQLFGKSASELNPLIEGGVETLEQMSKQANDLGLILSQEALDGANAFNDELDILKANGKGIFNVLGTEIASQLVPAMKSINELTSGWIKEITSVIEKSRNADEPFKEIAKVLSNIVGDALTKMISALPKIAELGIEIIKTLIGAIKDNASSIGEAGGDLLTTLITGLYEILPDLVDTAIKVVASFVSTIAGQLPDLIPTIVNGLLAMVDAIINNIDLIIDAGIKLIEGLIDGLIKATPKLVEKVPYIVTSLVNGFLDLTIKLVELGAKYIQMMAKGLTEFLQPLTDGIQEVWLTIKSTFLKAFEGAKNIGKNLIEGIWNGIKNAKDWLIGKIQQFCTDALGAIKSFFGIESPSKVMANEVGKYMAQGIGVGFGNTIPSVINAMQEKLSAVTGALQTELNIGDIPQIQGNQIVSENQYVTRNYTNTIETIRQPQTIELVLDGTKLARALIQPLDNEYNRLGVKI